jgi:alanine dehydrogenase
VIKVFGAGDVRARAPMPRVIECLEKAFARQLSTLPRQVVRLPGTGERLLLEMPAFDIDGGGAVKLATVFPDNAARGMSTIQAAIVVFSNTGTPVAFLDGTTITHLRTGGASALASKYLSRADSSHLVIIGTGALAPSMAAAHCAVRPIRRISVCGRSSERAAATVDAIQARVPESIDVVVAAAVEEAVATADIVSCSTSSATPVLAGTWLKPGAFIDLVGSFSPSKRESDDDVVLRSRIFVDTLEGALSEAGDLLDPMARGVISRERIEGELADLVRGRIKGRTHADEITLFKSVGTAIEDLAVAQLIVGSS